MAAQDFTKTPEEICLEMIKQTNSTASALTTGMLTYGLPTVDTGDRNSIVTVTALAGSGYKGSVNMHYNRVDIATIPGSRSKTFPIGDATKLSDFIPEINEAYAINLSPEDYTDVDLVEFPGVNPNETQNVALVINPDSLCFIGTLTIIVMSDDILLSSVILNNVMNGLTYEPTPDESV